MKELVAPLIASLALGVWLAYQALRATAEFVVGLLWRPAPDWLAPPQNALQWFVEWADKRSLILLVGADATLSFLLASVIVFGLAAGILFTGRRRYEQV